MTDRSRYFIELCFNGTPYHGWQAQPNAITVQEVLNGALTTLFRQNIETLGCGRTDTGVHASQFFAHFDLNSTSPTPDARLLASLNRILPNEIAAKRFIKVLENAHARFDASLRTYDYHIHFNKDPFRDQFSWLLREKPDIALMNKAAEIIKEFKDFSCFSKSNTQVFTNNCSVSEANWTENANSITFRISADRFLRNMVRAIVGTLLQIGRGEIDPKVIRSIIESGDRSNAGFSVPAHGLFLAEVQYPYLRNTEKN